MADAFDDYALTLTPWMYLRLEETSGVDAADASGNSQVGTYANSPTLNQKPISFDGTGRSVLFNGANQYITVPYHANFDSSEFTVATHINILSLSGYNSIFQHGDNASSGNQGYFCCITSAGKLSFSTYSGGSWNSVTTTNAMVSAGIPAFIAMNFTGTSFKCYLNGSLFQNLSWTFGAKATSNSTVKIAVAKDSSLTYYLNGSLSRIMYFASSLTADQIKTLYEKMVVSYRGAPLEVGKPQTQNRFTRWGH